MVISQVFRDPVLSVRRAPLMGQASLLETLRAGIAEQLAVLDDPSLTGTGRSSAQVLGLSVTTIVEKLTGYLVREILVQGSRGGPLEPLAAQLNHDVTHMQGQRLEVLVGQLADEVRNALAWRERDSGTRIRLEAVERAARAGYVTNTRQVPTGYLLLGAILDDEDHRFFVVPASLIQRGVLISGDRPDGIDYILEALAEARAPWLLIEPREPYAEVVRLAHVPALYIIENDLESVPVKFSPLEPETGFPLQIHLNMVRALFMAALGSSSESFPHSLSVVLEDVYERLGWDVPTGTTLQPEPIFPELVNLKYANRHSWPEHDKIPAADEAVINALVQLLLSGQAHPWLELGYSVSMEKLFNTYAVARIADAAPETKGFLIGTLILRIFEHVKVVAREGASQGLRHATVIKDASILLSSSLPSPRSESDCKTLADLLVQMSHYGESVILYERSPARLMPDVLNRTGLKIIHRLSAPDDRNAISAAINADSGTSARLMTLEPGVAMVMAEGMERPVEIQMESARYRLGSGRVRNKYQRHWGGSTHSYQ